MFTDPQTTVNTLVTLEDACIAAYLIELGQVSTNSLKVIAGQFLGVVSEHRALARVITSDLNLTEATGLAGAESVVAPSATSNNLAYERLFFTSIGQVVSAPGPFVTPGHSGFSAMAYPFATAQAAAPSAGQPLVVLANSKPSQI